MNNEINYENNPLNGVGLKAMLTDIVEHYGFEILYAYLSINCFNNNPSIASSVIFLKKTEWAREKVEAFYLYQFKNLPNPSSEQFAVPPRDRIIPDEQKPNTPAELSLEDAERLNELRAKKAAEHGKKPKHGSSKNYNAQRGRNSNRRERGPSDSSSKEDNGDPWGKWKK